MQISCPIFQRHKNCGPRGARKREGCVGRDRRKRSRGSILGSRGRNPGGARPTFRGAPGALEDGGHAQEKKMHAQRQAEANAAITHPFGENVYFYAL